MCLSSQSSFLSETPYHHLPHQSVIGFHSIIYRSLTIQFTVNNKVLKKQCIRVSLLSGGAEPNEESSPLESSNPQQCSHLPIAYQQRSVVADPVECVPCLELSP
jgi:hypothetical protein